MEQLEIRRIGVAREYDETAAFECVQKSEAFNNWLCSATSQVFVLSGRNDSHATHCWLSPIGLKLITDKTSPEATQNAANVCISEIINLRNEGNTFAHITQSLIYRLLLNSKHGLRKEREVEKLERHLETYSRLLKGQDVPMYQLQEILASILAQSLMLFDSGTTVWIIIDRADQCRTSRAIESSGTRNQQRNALLKTLVHAAEKSRIVLKVLVIVKATDWDVQKYARDIGQERDDSVVIETFEDENCTY